MSWGLRKGSATYGAPVSGKAAQTTSNGHMNRVTRGPSRPGKPAAINPKRPGGK